MLKLYVDADACPVKDEAIQVASRHKMEVFMVSNGGVRPSRDPMVHSIIVEHAFDAADNWIVEHVEADDVVVTADILLAQRCLHNGATAINPNGKLFTANNIGSAVAMRALHSQLRETGEISNYNPSFSKQDRSHFLQSLENAIQKIKHS
ncbi:MAG: YaiI/YqxD family protein [Alphaproteobacteria bacterium]|nr:YaiI/YqxD family protein [Alphaproteobacteria bacterium]